MLFAKRHAFVEPSLAHYLYQPSNVPIVPVRRALKGCSASSRLDREKESGGGISCYVTVVGSIR